ncbi:hypothetical protein [Rothia sp. (in: high G+C Gram-positive bacteria)]|uniref:hypothetical protein n=1 Tax=Rothia sp. (in: high G+C Gram-positive bacteria) TaxID=1885016 RepID=UPI0032178397
MAYSHEKQEEIEQIIISCRPEIDDVDFWAEQIKARVSAEDLDQHCLYLDSRLEELMDEISGSGLRIGSAEHSLELVKIADIGNYLFAIETALGRN